MEYPNNFFKRLLIYCISAGVIAFTAAGCGSSNEDQTAQTEEQVEQPAEPQAEMQEPEQNDMEEVETQEVVNPIPVVERNSAEFKRLAAMKEANRNNEVLAGIDVRYGDWDNDGDNVLNEGEFYKGFYSVWDKDNSNSVNEDEFQVAAENLFINYDFDEFGDFAQWDADGNSELSEQEFDNGLKSAIKASNNPETVSRLFTVWDLDNDKKIERIELGEITIILDADDN